MVIINLFIYGLCKRILGWRADLRAGTDFDGKDEDASGKNHGSFGMRRCRTGRNPIV